jgi:hypothetical protein
MVRRSRAASAISRAFLPGGPQNRYDTPEVILFWRRLLLLFSDVVSGDVEILDFPTVEGHRLV